MKKIYLSIFLASSATLLNSQITEGFEGSTFPPAEWTHINNDNTANAIWQSQGALTIGATTFAPNSGTKYAASYSNVGGFGIIPDNWLVTPKMSVDATTADLTFFAMGSNTYGEWTAPGEKLEVYVSTTGTAITDFVSIWSNRFNPAAIWNTYTLSLAAYNGQEIYIAFRHYDSYNENFVGLDDVSISNVTVIAAISNTAPIATDDNGGTIQENGADGTVNILANDTDADGNPSATSGHTVDLDVITPGIQTSMTSPIDQSVWTYNAATGVVTCNPAANFDGNCPMIYTLCDAGGLCDNATITFTVQNTTGIVENTLISAIYPNPVKDVLTIETSAKVQKIAVLGLDGKEISAYKVDSKINVANLNTGIYFLAVTAENGSVSKTKFIKE